MSALLTPRQRTEARILRRHRAWLRRAAELRRLLDQIKAAERLCGHFLPEITADDYRRLEALERFAAELRAARPRRPDQVRYVRTQRGSPP